MEEMGSQIQVRRLKKRGSFVGANPGDVAKEDGRHMDGYAPQCGEEAGCERRMGAEKTCMTLVGQTKRRANDVEKIKRERQAQVVPLPSTAGNEKLRKWEQRAKTSISNGKEASRRILSAEATGGSHLSVRRRESEKHRSWGKSVEGFRDSVATDDSLLEVSGM